MLLRPVLVVEPMLCRAEVYTCAVSRYFDGHRVRHELGYTPLVAPAEAMRRTLDYYSRIHPRRKSSSASSLLTPPRLLFYTLFLFLCTALYFRFS